MTGRGTILLIHNETPTKTKHYSHQTYYSHINHILNNKLNEQDSNKKRLRKEKTKMKQVKSYAIMSASRDTLLLNEKWEKIIDIEDGEKGKPTTSRRRRDYSKLRRFSRRLRFIKKSADQCLYNVL